MSCSGLGCITYHGAGELVIVESSMDHVDTWLADFGVCSFLDNIAILEQNPQQSIQITVGDANVPFIFQQENAPMYRARNVEAWLVTNDIHTCASDTVARLVSRP